MQLYIQRGKAFFRVEAFLAPKMETWPPAHWHIYEEDPENTGLHTVTEGEDGHQEKSVLKKVKTKAKKLKDTLGIKKNGHDHDQDDDHDHDDEEEEDGEDIEQDPEVHGAPMYESAAARTVPTPLEDKSGQSTAGLGPTPQLPPLEKDPQAPKDQLEPSDPGNYQTKVTDPAGPGGKEAEVTPLISSFEKMEVSEEPGEHKPWSSTGSHDQFSPDLPPTETRTIGENTQGNQSKVSEVQEQQNQSSYAEKISSATSTIAKKLAPVYEKVAETGSAVVSKMQGTGTEREGEAVGGTGIRVSVKEYVVVKLRPSDEDKALSEVISQAFHGRKKVTESPEVVRRLGSDHSEKTPEGLSSMSEAEKGKMGRIKGVVSSWFGKSGKQQHQRTAQASHGSSPVGGEDCQDIASERKLHESTN